jgi:hypothetical protein
MQRLVTRGFGKRQSITDDDISIITRGLGTEISSVVTEILTGLGLFTNVKRSLDKYFYNNIYTTEGLSIDFDGVPFDQTAVAESWVQPRIIEVVRDYVRQASGTKYGNSTDVELKVNIFVKKSGATLTHKHYLLRDKVAQYFEVGRDIDLKDYVGDSATLANMRVRSISMDSPLPETDTTLGYEVSWIVNYTEEITDALEN